MLPKTKKPSLPQISTFSLEQKGCSYYEERAYLGCAYYELAQYLVNQLKFRYLSRVSLKITGNRGKVFILELELRLLVQKGIDSVGLTG